MCKKKKQLSLFIRSASVSPVILVKLCVSCVRRVEVDALTQFHKNQIKRRLACDHPGLYYSLFSTHPKKSRAVIWEIKSLFRFTSLEWISVATEFVLGWRNIALMFHRTHLTSVFVSFHPVFFFFPLTFIDFQLSHIDCARKKNAFCPKYKQTQ